jgi:hypothetical protein
MLPAATLEAMMMYAADELRERRIHVTLRIEAEYDNDECVMAIDDAARRVGIRLACARMDPGRFAYPPPFELLFRIEWESRLAVEQIVASGSPRNMFELLRGFTRLDPGVNDVVVTHLTDDDAERMMNEMCRMGFFTVMLDRRIVEIRCIRDHTFMLKILFARLAKQTREAVLALVTTSPGSDNESFVRKDGDCRCIGLVRDLLTEMTA